MTNLDGLLVGSVGLTELQAVKKFGRGNVKIYSAVFTSMYYALLEQKPKNSFKMIVAGPEEKVRFQFFLSCFLSRPYV
jgi:glutathione reductase (NADPH)